MKVLKLTFMTNSICTRNDMFVNFSDSQGILDQQTLSNFTKLGKVPASTLRGWIRNGVEKLLLSLGISVCHISLNIPSQNLIEPVRPVLED